MKPVAESAGFFVSFFNISFLSLQRYLKVSNE